MVDTPASLDIRADRSCPFRRDVPVVGYDFTGAAFVMQIRAVPDAPDPALVNLTTQTTDIQGVRLIYAGFDTVANHIAAGRIPEAPPGYELTDSVTMSLLGLRIDKTVMKALSPPFVVGDTAELAWSLHITPSGGFEDRYAGGKFIVVPDPTST